MQFPCFAKVYLIPRKLYTRSWLVRRRMNKVESNPLTPGPSPKMGEGWPSCKQGRSEGVNPR